MISQEDKVGLELTNDEVDDALNFGIAFDRDVQNEVHDNTLPTFCHLNSLVLTRQGSSDTRSPEPSFDDESLTSTGSKRSRTDFSRGGEIDDENSPKRRMPLNNMLGWSGEGDGHMDTTLTAIQIDRIREGRCPDCGLETHIIVKFEKRYQKTPMNVSGEVLNGRCLFCYPLEEVKQDEDKGNAGKDAKKIPAPIPTASKFVRKRSKGRKSYERSSSEIQTSREHHAKVNDGKNENEVLLRASSVFENIFKSFPNNLDKDHASQSSQCSRSNQGADGVGQLGKATSEDMRMNGATETPRHAAKSPQCQAQSPRLRDPSTLVHSFNSSSKPTENGERDTPARVRLAHCKSLSSIYHHHLFPMSNEMEEAYEEKTLAYLESGMGDIADVIGAMRRFPFSTSVQSLCCEKIYVLCFDNDHARAIALVGGIKTVLDAMENHPKDIVLQRKCAGIIRHIAAASQHNLDVLHSTGVVNILVTRMQQNQTCAQSLESCCWALGSMANGGNQEMKLSIVKAGAVLAAMGAVERFPRNESILRSAFYCLQQLGYNPSSYAAQGNLN